MFPRVLALHGRRWASISLPLNTLSTALLSSVPTAKFSSSNSHQNAILQQVSAGCHQQQQLRFVHLSSPLAKGSSPFMKYGALKAKKDGDRAKIISKMVQSIIKVSRDAGGADPSKNKALASLLAQCNELAIPKATIDKTLERAKNNTAEKMVMCLTGPGDSIFILEGEVTKDQRNKMEKSVRKVLLKLGLTGFGPGGTDAIQHFEEKGIMLILSKHSDSKNKEHSLANEEAAETLAIELGAEDVEACSDDDGNDAFEFVFQPFELSRASEESEARGYEVVKSTVEYRPTVLRMLTDSQLDIVKQFYAGFDNQEIIENIYDNIAWPSS